jgi:acetolactate synthase-1/2/3 large subunit
MSEIKYPAAPGFESEAPVNLPRNRSDAEYGSDLVAELFGKLGHDYIFLTPGSSFRGVHDSLVNHTRNHKPQIILCAHEEIAMAMGQGYAKATGKPGLVFLHDLVGVQHAAMAFYNAWADRQPVVVLGGSGPADPAMRRRIDWVHSANTQCEMVRNYTKWTDEPATLQATLDSIARAQRVASSAPCAPVYVSVDTIIQEAKIANGARLPDVDHPRYRAAPPLAAAKESIEAAVELLIAADWPLIAGGRIGYRADCTPPLVKLVELLGAVYKDSHDIVCFPTAHPQNMSGGFGATKETEMLPKADVVLGFDVPDLNALLGLYGQAREHLGRSGAAKREKKIIDVSLNDLMLEHWSNLNGGLSPADVQVLAEPHYALRQLLAEVEARAKGNPAWVKRARERAAEIAELHKALRARQREAVKADWERKPISVARMQAELWEAVKNKDYMTGLRNYRSWYEGIWEYKGGGQHLSNNVGGGVGYGPGGILGSAIAGRDMGKFNLAILGDGDFTMGPAALWTAVHYKIPIMIVLHNNTSFGNDEEHQITLAEERKRPVENAWIGQRMVGPEPDYCAIARGYGAWAEQPVRDPKDLKEAFRKAVEVVDKGGVALVDVHTQLN